MLHCRSTLSLHRGSSSRGRRPLPLSTQLSHARMRLVKNYKSYQTCKSLLDDISITSLLLPAGGVLLLGGVGYLVYLYSQIEYITAAMLSRHVPAQSSVIQVGGGTKELFYYPKSTEKVVVVGENVNKGLMEQGGVQAGTPTICKDTNPSEMRFAGTSTVDTVVCIRAFSQLGSLTGQGFLMEAARVLKPGSKLIFVEQASSGILSALSTKSKQFEQVEYDQFLEGLYPHVAGVAIKSKDWNPPSTPSASKSGAKQGPADNKGGNNKGF